MHNRTKATNEFTQFLKKQEILKQIYESKIYNNETMNFDVDLPGCGGVRGSEFIIIAYNSILNIYILIEPALDVIISCLEDINDLRSRVETLEGQLTKKTKDFADYATRILCFDEILILKRLQRDIRGLKVEKTTLKVENEALRRALGEIEGLIDAEKDGKDD